jgi:P27 family predicted phage terminase small subunit
MKTLLLELHNITSPMNEASILPFADTGHLTLPVAEWMDNPSAWNKKKFVDETAEFLCAVFSNTCHQDRHLLAMLADQMETYIDCNRQIHSENLLVEQNDGKTIGTNPWVSIREKTLVRIIALMNELGLTPKSRKAAGKTEYSSSLAEFLKGPFGR